MNFVCGARAGEPELAQGHGDRIGDDHPATVALDVAQHVVDLALAPELDPVKRLLERIGELGVGGR